MKLYCYHIPPIDFWFAALTGSELLSTAWRGLHEDWAQMASACRQVDELKTAAEVAFKTIDWEGDVRQGPYYFAVPDDTELSLGYIIKQDNNGNCFVASPVALPHLDELAFARTITGGS